MRHVFNLTISTILYKDLVFVLHSLTISIMTLVVDTLLFSLHYNSSFLDCLYDGFFSS